MKPMLFVVVIVAFAACRQGEKTDRNLKNGSKSVSNKGPDGLKNATVDPNFFDKPVAVFISPSDRMIEKTRKKLGEDDFAVAADDGVWYQSESDKFLDAVDIRQVHRESEGSLRFLAANGKVYTMRVDTLFFGVILFDGKSAPLQADPTNMEAEYKRYMQK